MEAGKTLQNRKYRQNRSEKGFQWQQETNPRADKWDSIKVKSKVKGKGAVYRPGENLY